VCCSVLQCVTIHLVSALLLWSYSQAKLDFKLCSVHCSVSLFSVSLFSFIVQCFIVQFHCSVSLFRSIVQCEQSCSVLQCVAVRVAVYCSVLQSVAVCCSGLQFVAVYCSVLQSVAVCCSVLRREQSCSESAACGSMSQIFGS